MNKSYIVFTIILAALIISYMVTKRYLADVRESATELSDAALRRAYADSLETEIRAMMAQYEEIIDHRLDSLEQTYRKLENMSDSVADTPTAADLLQDSAVAQALAALDTIRISDSTTAATETQKSDISESPQPQVYIPTGREIEIYNKYLKMRWDLPSDLTKYELRVEKADIYDKLGGKYDLTRKQVMDVVDSVYYFRKRQKRE